QVPRLHLLHDVLVADGTADDLDAERSQGQFEADVAHHGRDDRISSQPAFSAKLFGAHQQHGIPVDDFAPVIDEDRTITVAVECNPQGAPALDDEAVKWLGMGRSAMEVDIAAVWPVACHDRPEAEALEQGG